MFYSAVEKIAFDYNENVQICTVYRCIIIFRSKIIRNWFDVIVSTRITDKKDKQDKQTGIDICPIKP